MGNAFSIEQTQVIDNPAKDHFSATVARCYPSNHDLVLEFAAEDGSPRYRALTILASKPSAKEILTLSESMAVPLGISGKWTPKVENRDLVAPPRRASVFHLAVAGSHGIAVISPASFDMLSLMTGPTPEGPILRVPAFLSVDLSLSAFADLLADIRSCLG